jgi:serine/threonine protein phosphatase PrpC
VLADAGLSLFIVADGMGGHNAGEVASQLAVDVTRKFVLSSRNGDDITWPNGLDTSLSFNANCLMAAVKVANRSVFKLAESRDEYSGMGTTVVAALIEGAHMVYAAVGDSRLYSFMDGKLAQLTDDDSWVAAMAKEAGANLDALATHPMRHVLTNALGAREQTEVQIGERDLTDGESLLLCSDGLHGAIDDDTIRDILATSPGAGVAAERLVSTALHRNGSDNITAVVVKYTS